MTIKTDRHDAEYCIDNGLLWVLMGSGRYWRLRRNGRTQTWKRDTLRFRIPVKAGLYVFSEITEQTVIDYRGRGDIIHSVSDPNGERKNPSICHVSNVSAY